MADVDKYTGVLGHHMPRYESYPYPQRLSVLNETLKIHTLREIGDIKRYLDLQDKITALGAKEPPVCAMAKWLDMEIDKITPTTQERDILVVSLLAFGKSYIQKMLDYTFKSFMAPGNFPALLKEKKIIVYIQTDQLGQSLIEAADIAAKLKALGVLFDYAIIPDKVIELLDNNDSTYWMLGAGASLGLHYAKCMGAAFHHSFPDMVYSDKFFSELLRLSKTHMAILCSGCRSDESLMIPAITPYLTDDSLSVPSGDLMAHHLNCLHLVSWPYVVNNRGNSWSYPQSHVMIWESQDHVCINSPHHNALWLDYSLIKNLPSRFYWTLDSEMDLICKGEDYYIVQECDELYQAELSAPERASITDKYADAVTCAKLLWNAVSHRDLVKFFLRGQKIKINSALRINANPMTDQQIESETKFLFNAIMATDPYAGSELLVDRTHAGRVYG